VSRRPGHAGEFSPAPAVATPPRRPPERRADPPPDFSVGSSQSEASDTHRDFAPPSALTWLPLLRRRTDPLLASAHDDLAPNEVARRAADAIHENCGEAGKFRGRAATLYSPAASPVSTRRRCQDPSPRANARSRRRYCRRRQPHLQCPRGSTHTPTKMSAMPTQPAVESPRAYGRRHVHRFVDRRSVVAVMETALRPDAEALNQNR